MITIQHPDSTNTATSGSSLDCPNCSCTSSSSSSSNSKNRYYNNCNNNNVTRKQQQLLDHSNAFRISCCYYNNRSYSFLRLSLLLFIVTCILIPTTTITSSNVVPIVVAVVVSAAFVGNKQLDSLGVDTNRYYHHNTVFATTRTRKDILQKEAGVVNTNNFRMTTMKPFTVLFSNDQQHIVESSSATSNDDDDDANNNIMWQLFCKHHAKCNSNEEHFKENIRTTTSWVGKWTTFDYVGDVVLETIPASVNYMCTTSSTNTNDPCSIMKVDVTHSISTGSVSSDCTTCYDDPNIMRTIPIASYTPETMYGGRSSTNNNNNKKNIRLGACGMVVGPSILRSSGTMATELVLSHESYRVRIVFQHAPVWARDIEPGSCPPQGMKLIRCLLSRETLAPSSSTTTTTDHDNDTQVERNWSDIPMPGTGNHPIFDRSVPPFDWHKKWSGTSWTWGIEAGDRGWSIPELEIGVDDWHGCAPVEAWNLRIPGGIFIQLPRVITGDATERCRLAWMPDVDTLLRLEAGVTALQPIYDTSDNPEVVGFEPPMLVSLRCDVLQKDGDLDGVPSFVKQQQDDITATDQVKEI